MKRSIILAAIAIMALCVVSCKKSENPEPTREKTPSNTYYKVPEVEDMNAYLKEFKQKMQTRGNDDTMALDEAAWHLSAIANYDFGDVVSNYKNFHYDTLYYNINVENGRVSLSDLNALYATASADITDVFQNLNLENKHIRFIGADIKNDGSVCMSILVTYGWMDHQWYFPDVLTLFETLSPYFDDTYYCDYETFTDTLTAILKELLCARPEDDVPNHYFVTFKTVDFEYYNYPDPYAQDYFLGYRIFATHGTPGYFTSGDFFYYFDSYAALSVDSSYFQWGQYNIVDYRIAREYEPYSNFLHYHRPKVNYGWLVTGENGQQPQH